MFCLGVQLYRSLGIRVMLVGLEIWTYGDQIEDSPYRSGAGSGEVEAVSRHGDWVDVFQVPETDLSVGLIEGGQGGRSTNQKCV